MCPGTNVNAIIGSHPDKDSSLRPLKQDKTTTQDGSGEKKEYCDSCGARGAVGSGHHLD